MIDLCAAPGGKALGLAERAAHVAAADLSPRRMARVAENAARVGWTDRLGAVVADARMPPFRAADAVLLDAPCTGTGTFRRHPDGRWRVTEADLAALVVLQAELLAAAAPLVRPGGVLVYSTCSLEREENEERVEAFLAEHPEFAPWSRRPARCPRRCSTRRAPLRAPAAAGRGRRLRGAAAEARVRPPRAPKPARPAVGPLARGAGRRVKAYLDRHRGHKYFLYFGVGGLRGRLPVHHPALLPRLRARRHRERPRRAGDDHAGRPPRAGGRGAGDVARAQPEQRADAGRPRAHAGAAGRAGGGARHAVASS